MSERYDMAAVGDSYGAHAASLSLKDVSVMEQSNHVLPCYRRIDLNFVRGQGAYLFDADDNAYLDFTSGIGVNAFGHAHPRLIEALSAQAQKLWHLSNLFHHSAQQKLAETLCQMSNTDYVFFTNSGAEAIECAIKMARKFFAARNQPVKNTLITFEGAFHGRTLATIAAGGKAQYLNGFEPSMPGFRQVAFDDLAAAEAAISDDVAGFLIEPIQGEGGIRAASPEFLRGLRRLADRHDILVIFDEIQCGLSRTGRFFAHEWADTRPDILTLAKALGGGFPVGACLATERVGAAMGPGSHGSTYGGNPLAMAVAQEVLAMMSEPNFLTRVQHAGRNLSAGLEALRDAYPAIIAEIRGLGLMLGLKCHIPAASMLAELRRQKLLAVAAGPDVIRLLPPLIVTDAEIERALQILTSVCAEIDRTSS